MSTEDRPLTATILTKIIEIRDPWGKTHRAHVSWMPLSMRGVDAARDNCGLTEVAFADVDHCPIQWRLDPATSCAELVRPLVPFTGDIEMLAQGYRVDSLDELAPGRYHRVISS